MDKKPVIGVTCPRSEETWGSTEAGGYNYAGCAYVDAIYRAGGIPVLIPPVFETESLNRDAENILRIVDGIYFTGGGDVKRPPSSELKSLYEQQPVRSVWEETLIKFAYKIDMPVLGVCRGHQMIAVALGGEMDTVRREEHKQSLPMSQGSHNVIVEKGTLLYDLIGEEKWFVNSLHVERVKELPTGFINAAVADDGGVEAIAATGKLFFMGTQFHPELMPDDEKSNKIFTGFIAAAKKYKEYMKN